MSLTDTEWKESKEEVEEVTQQITTPPQDQQNQENQEESHIDNDNQISSSAETELSPDERNKTKRNSDTFDFPACDPFEAKKEAKESSSGESTPEAPSETPQEIEDPEEGIEQDYELEEISVQDEGLECEDLECEEDEEEDTLSSEAVVDDIELILLPEEADDLPSDTPHFVRVTELKDSEFEAFEDEEEEDGRMSSAVQTDITALEKGFGPASRGNKKKKILGGKRLNWKSELTLLPSKVKIGDFGRSGLERQDEFPFSPRVSKFTSQDNVLACSSQFLKPSSLYRTRNLSRNLNRFDSSESTLVFPEETSSSVFLSARERTTSFTSSSHTKGYLAGVTHQISTSSLNVPFGSNVESGRRCWRAPSFRSSLPDLTSPLLLPPPPESFKVRGGRSYSTGGKTGKKLGRKMSLSDDETSSLIDESERCLRSSIDLLLTEDYGSSFPRSSYKPQNFGYQGSSRTSGYGSARRSTSQPILIDESDYRDEGLGSPFLPRRVADLRTSRYAKVILPTGHVGIVAVKELDELRDSLTVHTDTGCILSLPFRKVVFAWRPKR